MVIIVAMLLMPIVLSKRVYLLKLSYYDTILYCTNLVSALPYIAATAYITAKMPIYRQICYNRAGIAAVYCTLLTRCNVSIYVRIMVHRCQAEVKPLIGQKGDSFTNNGRGLLYGALTIIGGKTLLRGQEYDDIFCCFSLCYFSYI